MSGGQWHRLTETMLGMFLEWDAERDSTRYTLALSVEFSKSVDAGRLAAATEAALRADPIWRVRLVEKDGAVGWTIDEEMDIRVARRSATDAEVERERRTFARGFDVFAGPLVRFSLAETPTRSVLFVEVSHLVCDGTSMRVLLEEIGRRYDGAAARERENGAEVFAAYAEREAEGFGGADYAAAKAAAEERFDGRSMTVPRAGTAGAEVPAEGFWKAQAEVPGAAVDAFCAANGTDANLFFAAAFARTLSMFANEKDVVFWTVNHGRGKDPVLREASGCFVKSVPVLGELKGAARVADFVRSFKLHRAGVYPFTHFCRDLGMKPGWGYVFQKGTVDISIPLAGRRWEGLMAASGGAGEMPGMQVFGGDKGYRLVMVCGPGRYDGAFLERFVSRMATVAENLASAGGEARLGDVPVLTAAEAAEVRTLSYGGDLDYDRAETFVDLFRAQAAARPGATAVAWNGGRMTYGELDARSDELAAALAAAGVKPGDFAAVKLGRTGEFVAAALAVQKCGAGYVPLDPDYPEDRLAYILADSGASAVADAAFCAGVKRGGGAARAARGLAKPEGPAYMIYTSGTTGRPKGVSVPHRALRNSIAWAIRDYGLGPESKVASHPSFSFDASVLDIFPVLAAGGELHILGEEMRKDPAAMREYIVANGITGLTMSTQIGMLMLEAFPDLPIRYLRVGGEKLTGVREGTAATVVNEYGPTEFCVTAAHHAVAAGETEIPIGRPVANTHALIVDPLGQPLPPGMAGEIALAGVQLADGYWGKPEATAKAFVECPFLGGRMYRTGDLGRYGAGGELEFMGRIDFQVKLRGFRIEPGEIERVASGFAGVTAAVALVRKVGGADHLVLYYTQAGGEEDGEALRAHLAKALPGYMVPDFFVKMERMPLTGRGKIDRKALPEPGSGGAAVAAKGELEASLLACAQAVLRRDDFGVTDDFGRLGLSSLGAMQLASAIQEATGVRVSLRQLEAHPTVRALAGSGLFAGASKAAKAAASGEVSTVAPMGENQLAVYADWLRNPGRTQYNIATAVRFSGVRGAALAAAAEKALAAHAAFGVRFAERDGTMVQESVPQAWSVSVERVATEPDEAFWAARVKPFASDAESLTRCFVVECEGASHLFLDAHHTIFDGFSMGVFLREVMAALGGADVAKETRSILDAARAEAAYLSSADAATDERWFGTFLGGTGGTSVERSASGTEAKAGAEGRASRCVAGGVVDRRCAASGASASDFFLTAFTETLRRCGGGEKPVIQFVSAGRSEAGYGASVGMFAKTLPIRGVGGAGSVEDAVRRMHGSVRDVLERERVSYVRLAERFGLRPDILFVFEGGLFDLPAGVKMTSVPCDTAKAPLSVTVTPETEGGGYELAFEYDASMYSAADMERLLARFARLCEAMAERGGALTEVPDGDDGAGPRAVCIGGTQGAPAAAPAAAAVGVADSATEQTIAKVYGEVLGAERFGAEDDFFERGGTSIVAIRALVALQKAGLEVQYGDLFQYKTPRALAGFLSGGAPAAGDGFDFGAYDYAPIDRMLAGTRTDFFGTWQPRELGRVLVTGAAGFLGMHVVRYLLASTGAEVWALARSKGRVGAERRLDSQWVYYFGERVPEPLRARLHVVEGDVADAGLAAALAAAGCRPDTVLNCAAVVKHYAADDAMERVNVRGTENLIALCESTGARLVQMSTYSVGGTVRAESAASLDERHLYIGQETDNEYIRTKFLGERTVLAATAAGRIRGKVMRLGNLMGRESDGEFQMNAGANAFVNSLKTYTALGAYPLEDLARSVEMSPIDRVAAAVCLLAGTPDDQYIFHPYNRYGMDMGAVMEALRRRGHAIEYVSAAEFARRVEARKQAAGGAEDLQGILHYAGHLLEGRRPAGASNGHTTTALYRLGFRWKPADDGYLERFFDMLEGIGAFEERTKHED